MRHTQAEIDEILAHYKTHGCMSTRKKFGVSSGFLSWHTTPGYRERKLKEAQTRDPNKIRQYNQRYNCSKTGKNIKTKTREKWLSKNPEYQLTYLQQWRKRNKRHISIWAARRHKERMQTDINYRLRKALRSRVKGALAKKSEKTLSLIGCTVAELKTYLERQFKPGMAWSNYGNNSSGKSWQIDHIIPVAAFDLTKIEDQYKCFHYTNLQPMWMIDNIRKGSKLQS